MFTIDYIQPFTAYRCGNHWPAERHCLQDLQPCTATRPQRDYTHCTFLVVRHYILDSSRNMDAIAVEFQHLRRRIPPDYAQLHWVDYLANQGKNLPTEIEDSINAGWIPHAPDEYQRWWY